jgi:hypothetical protein
MRTTLTIFSLLWFAAGLVLLALGLTLETVPLLQILEPVLAAPGSEVHPVFGNIGTYLTLVAATAWALVFCVPALLLAALGAMLARLDKLAQTRVEVAPVGEITAPAKKRVVVEKVEPHIGKI